MFKKRRSVVIGLSMIVLLAFYYTTWGLVIETGTRFVYLPPEDYDCATPDPPPEQRIFIPSPFIGINGTTIPTVLIINFVYWSHAPFDISMYRSDITYLESHAEFKSFRLDELTIEYSDGTTSELVNADTPLESRKYEIDEYVEPIVFRGAIKKDQDFLLRLSGQSTKKSGEVIPFSITRKYRSVSAFRVYTLLESFASV